MSHASTEFTAIQCSQAPLYSEFGVGDLADLVEMFVDEMPQRIESLQALANGQDWESLGRAAHQLKGSAGSYGFGQLTPAAAGLESAIRNGEPAAATLAALEALLGLCRRVRAGG